MYDSFMQDMIFCQIIFTFSSFLIHVILYFNIYVYVCDYSSYTIVLKCGFSRYRVLYEEYHRPERSIAEAARMVGLKLPHDPK